MNFFFCPVCDAKNSVPHSWQGLRVTCPVCLKVIRLDYRNQQRIFLAGYEVTYTDFCQLFNSTSNKGEGRDLIAQLLECKVDTHQKHHVLCRQDGSVVPLEVAHIEIQCDAKKQKTLYNYAMSVWR